MSPNSQGEMTLMEHIEELRSRLLKALAGIALGFAVAFRYSQQLLDLFTAPLKRVLPPDAVIQYTDLPEPFFVHLKIGALAGFFLASPWVFYQIWKFVAPGLYAHEKQMVFPFVLFSTLFFSVGSVFCFYMVFPLVFEFFVKEFSTHDIQAIPKLGEYFSFATKLIFSFGIVFELPVGAFFLGRMGLITWRGMVAPWRYVIVVIFIVAAILTPPDVVSQCLLAGPLLILYGLSIGIVWLTGKEKEGEPGTAVEKRE